LVAQLFFKAFFAQTLLFFGVFFWGGWGACISGLPSYLLAYILTYLGYLFTYLPMYLGVDPYPYLPTSLQIYKIKNSKNYKLIITNCKFASLQTHKFESMQVYKFADLQI
jgi:hypothetical protein